MDSSSTIFSTTTSNLRGFIIHRRILRGHERYNLNWIHHVHRHTSSLLCKNVERTTAVVRRTRNNIHATSTSSLISQHEKFILRRGKNRANDTQHKTHLHDIHRSILNTHTTINIIIRTSRTRLLQRNMLHLLRTRDRRILSRPKQPKQLLKPTNTTSHNDNNDNGWNKLHNALQYHEGKHKKHIQGHRIKVHVPIHTTSHNHNHLQPPPKQLLQWRPHNHSQTRTVPGNIHTHLHGIPDNRHKQLASTKLPRTNTAHVHRRSSMLNRRWNKDIQRSHNDKSNLVGNTGNILPKTHDNKQKTIPRQQANNDIPKLNQDNPSIHTRIHTNSRNKHNYSNILLQRLPNSLHNRRRISGKHGTRTKLHKHINTTSSESTTNIRLPSRKNRNMASTTTTSIPSKQYR